LERAVRNLPLTTKSELLFKLLPRSGQMGWLFKLSAMRAKGKARVEEKVKESPRPKAVGEASEGLQA